MTQDSILQPEVAVMSTEQLGINIRELVEARLPNLDEQTDGVYVRPKDSDQYLHVRKPDASQLEIDCYTKHGFNERLGIRVSLIGAQVTGLESKYDTSFLQEDIGVWAPVADPSEDKHVWRKKVEEVAELLDRFTKSRHGDLATAPEKGTRLGRVIKKMARFITHHA